MPSWILTLIGSDGKTIASQSQEVDSLTRETVFVEEAPNGTLKLTKYFDKTQVRYDWVCQFEFEGGAIKFSSDVVDTEIVPVSPAHQLLSRVSLPFSAHDRHYFVLLRNGDAIEFEHKRFRIDVSFDPTGLDVQVESSGPGVNSRKIKRERIKEEDDSGDDETDDDTDDEDIQPPMNVRRDKSAEESQHMFSTSRENLSPTPRPVARESQIVKETPNRRRIRSQHESIVPESIPLDESLSLQPESAPNGDGFEGHIDVLPDIHNSELPNTSPSEMPHFHVPTQSTPSHLQESFTVEHVGELLSNLNGSNPPSQVPRPDSSPKKKSRLSPFPSQLYQESLTEEPLENANSPKPHANFPSVEPAINESESTASPMDIINDQITNNKQPTKAEDANDITLAVPSPALLQQPSAENTDGDDTATATPSPISSHDEVTIATNRPGRKRKTVSDSASATSSIKRARIIEVGETVSTIEATPTSTASKRGSGRSKDLGTPSGSASTRSSSYRKSLEENPPPNSISRRVSNRHKSIDSERAPSGSPSVVGRQYTGDAPVIIFSNTKTHERSQLMKFLKTQGASRTDDIKLANFLCVGHGELLKTPKLLHSLTLGKTIVTDDWVSRSVDAGMLLETSDFLPEELKATSHHDRTAIFTDEVIYVTPMQRLAYKKGWDDVMAIVRQAGGTNPLTGPLSKLDTSTITIYIGADKDDDVVAELQDQDVKVYKKDILGASIVQGELVLDEEMELSSMEVTVKTEVKTVKQEPKSAKKVGRKKKA
ncbi:hypothetical protein E4T47_03260 [Aureobasidium subglaciale]|nr:hypothetical protein E4T47_03260 [Aureobasidium subglaciale]